ncbi:MAG: alkaline phosphatase family protein [Chloroflexota bacterium]|nr:alkaline phosphatase family protein [Chloroflexota bacterium]
MHKTVVLNVVGLTPSLIGRSTPHIKAFADRAGLAHIDPIMPAVTCTASATYLTGKPPSVHGAVANGWYFREMDEIRFWRQSNKLVQAPKIWDMARDQDSDFTCANLFWWYNMNSSVDYLVTPRPMYPSDGRKIPDIYTKPMDLRDSLQADLGPFPLFNFWGPNATIKSSRWIADSAMSVEYRFGPTLTLVYLPHLDYPLQKYGTDTSLLARDLGEIDSVVGDLIAFYEQRDAHVVIVSEYGIQTVSRQIHLNRLFRERGWISYRRELGRDMLDPGGSRAFAVADHQIAHIYVNDPSILSDVRAAVATADGVATVLDEDGKRRHRLDHERSGELVALAEPDAWFTYYFWLDDDRAPDYARTVDIHQKPGYDPAELFFDPEKSLVKAKAGLSLAKRKLGFRCLLETVPLDGRYVKGSHGVPTESPDDGPLLLSGNPALVPSDTIDATDVTRILLNHLYG